MVKYREWDNKSKTDILEVYITWR